MIQNANKDRILAIRQAGGLQSVDDLLTLSFSRFKQSAGDRWRAREAIWTKKIEEIAADAVTASDAVLVENDRVMIIFHPDTALDRDDVLMTIIRGLRDYFLGEPELDISSKDGLGWRRPEGVQNEAVLGETVEADTPTPACGRSETAKAEETANWVAEGGGAVDDEEFNALDFGEDWRPTYRATWGQYALVDKRRVQHVLILPTIESELGGFDTSDAYYQSNDTLVEMDVFAVRAAGARALKAYKARSAGQVFFTINIETLRVSSYRERLWRDVRQIPKPLLSKMCPILVRVSPKLPAASAAEAIAHLRSFMPSVYMATAEPRQVEDGGPYFPVEGYFFAPPPGEPGAWRRFGPTEGVLALVKEHHKRAGVLSPLPRNECAEAISNGFDLAAIR